MGLRHDEANGLGDEVAFPGLKRRDVRDKFESPRIFADTDRIEKRNAVEKRQELMVPVRPFAEDLEVEI